MEKSWTINFMTQIEVREGKDEQARARGEVALTLECFLANQLRT